MFDQVNEDKRRFEEIQRRFEQQRIKKAEERRRRSSMERPAITYIPKGLTVDDNSYKEYYVYRS